MAEVRSKMTDVKCQLEARGETKAGPSGGATGVEQGPSYHSELGPSRKPIELDLMGKGPGVSRHCRSGERCHTHNTHTHYIIHTDYNLWNRIAFYVTFYCQTL